MSYYHENLRDARTEINNYLLGKEYNRDLLEKISSNDNGGTELGKILGAFSQLVNIKSNTSNNSCREAIKLTKELADLVK